jgi:phospholipid/cholesterol/gamma-HCH transport system permease protein
MQSFPCSELIGRRREDFVWTGAKSLLPAVVIFSIIKESGPIITALVVSGRAAAGIGAELGAM